MNILFCASEAVPFAKTGGLADVASALAKSLSKMGHEVSLFMPRYPMVDLTCYNLKIIFDDVEIALGEDKYNVSFFEGKIPGSEVVVYFVDSEDFFTSYNGLYQIEGKDIEENLERFSLYSKALFFLLRLLENKPHIIHVNDWQCGLIPAYLKILYKDDPLFSPMASVFTIHNLAYQGVFSKKKFDLLGLPEFCLENEALGYGNSFSLLKSGLVYADIINTVSTTYAQEIQTPELGFGLDALLKKRKSDLFGIINGVDYSLWDPKHDKVITKRYSHQTLSLKQENKWALQKKQNLKPDPQIPLLGIISRLCDQKGFDTLAKSMDDLMGLNVQLVVLGTGDAKYHQIFEALKEKFPKQLGVNLGFDSAMAEEIYAGCDMFLMPSHYEPCGLGQLISFKYGTVPIVRKTGGLADTVIDYTEDPKKGRGFVFEEPKDFIPAVKRALNLFQKDAFHWLELQKRIMTLDFSWDASAKEYITLYSKALDKINNR